jgi:chemotaxis protein methyltransferase WspC
MKQVEQSLREKIGLDASSIGSSLIQRTVRLRMKSLGLKHLQEYEELLAGSEPEWAELLESVVVTETWFFRDREPFTAFIRLVNEEWLPAHPTRPVRLLSVPCSSGEEPFSLVMALLDAGAPLERFQIDAADISSRALVRARKALYGRNSFRGKPLDFRDRHFQHTKEGYLLNPIVRNSVNFIHGNLLSQDFLAGKAPYDFVFCRNLLIYFDRPTQKRALETLSQLLVPSGVLFVGAAELPPVLDLGFVSANIPMAFACRKSIHAPPKPEGRPRPVKQVVLTSQPWAKVPAIHQPAPPRPNPFGSIAGVPPSISGTEDLEQARHLADAGRLGEAAALCEVHLRKHRDSAYAYYLLGVVREAGGDATAADCYRKALYLDPNHYESLLQMALLAEKNGDTTAARTFRRRAQRLKLKA